MQKHSHVKFHLNRLFGPGLHNWLDIYAKNLTLEGMQQGVRDSRIFLLFLSKHVLASWFCQQEILTAIDEGKPIQLVIEEEPRFSPFDLVTWRAQSGLAVRTVKNQTGEEKEVPKPISDMIDAHLPQAVTYRRRDFEQKAMMQELCHRNGIVVPIGSAETVYATVSRHPSSALRIAVIYNSVTAAGMFTDIKGAFANIVDKDSVVLTDESELATADRVLLLLSKGVLKSPTLQQLEEVIRLDATAKKDRIVALFSEQAGWRFGCDEHQTATMEIKDCLDAHEAISYRPKDPTGPHRHEFPAMFSHLLAVLGRPCACKSAAAIPPAAENVPLASVRERLAHKELAVVALETMLADKEVELIAMREKLAKSTTVAIE